MLYSARSISAKTTPSFLHKPKPLVPLRLLLLIGDVGNPIATHTTMTPSNGDTSTSLATDHPARRKPTEARASPKRPAPHESLAPRRTYAYDRAPHASIARRVQLEIGVLFMSWWASNSAYAVSTDRLFRAHPFNVYAIDLTLGQTLFTVILVLLGACIDHVTRISPMQSGKLTVTPLLHQLPALASLVFKSPALFVAAFAQVAAALLTALSYATVGAAPTLIWKFAEPLTTVLVKWIILRSIPMSSTPKATSRTSAGRTSPSAVIAILAILTGCVVFSWTADASLPQLVPVLLSNLLTPLRNTCFKRHQLRHGFVHTALPSFSIPAMMRASPRPTVHTPVMAFVILTLATCPFIPVLIILRIIFHNYFFVPASLTPFDLQLFTPSWASILYNSLLYTCYQCASVCLLSLVDPVTHAVLNAFKRLAALVVASVMLHFHQLSIRHAVAALLSASGFAAYALATHRETGGDPLTQDSQEQDLICLKKDDLEKPDAKTSRAPVQTRVIIVTFISIFAIAILFINLKTRTAVSVSHFNSIQHQTKQKNPHYWDNAIHVRVMPYTNETFVANKYANGRNIPGNLGDLLWKYAADESLVSFPTSRTVNCPIGHVSPWTCMHTVINPSVSQPVVIHAPLANYLSDHFEHLHLLSVYARHPLVSRVIITGIGVQESFPRRGLNSEDVRTDRSVCDAARAYQLSAPLRADIAALADTDRVTFLTRGEVSRLVLRKMGVLNAQVLGCPSIWANEDVRLGDKLFTKYDQLSKRVNDSSIKIAIPVKAFPRYYWLYKSLARMYPHATFIAQTSHDFVKLSDMAIPFSQVRTYKTAREWVADMKNFDVVFGARMHGILAGVMAATPVMAIAVDWRMAEICQALRIPFISPFDPMFEQKIPPDVAGIINEFVDPFDAPSFDRNRCRIARVVKETFESVGMTVRPHIEKIEHLC